MLDKSTSDVTASDVIIADVTYSSAMEHADDEMESQRTSNTFGMEFRIFQEK